jgi:hypothetical protein
VDRDNNESGVLKSELVQKAMGKADFVGLIGTKSIDKVQGKKRTQELQNILVTPKRARRHFSLLRSRTFA